MREAAENVRDQTSQLQQNQRIRIAKRNVKIFQSVNDMKTHNRRK